MNGLEEESTMADSTDGPPLEVCGYQFKEQTIWLCVFLTTLSCLGAGMESLKSWINS